MEESASDSGLSMVEEGGVSWFTLVSFQTADLLWILLGDGGFVWLSALFAKLAGCAKRDSKGFLNSVQPK